MYLCAVQTIGKLIEKLLRDHECVIVAGLGGFVVQYCEAKVALNTLVPPKRNIGFNAMLTNEDGLLAQAVMQDRGVTFQEATKIIAAEVKTLNYALDTDGYYVFGRIGSFMKTNGRVEFHPGKGEFLPENLGLQPIRLTLLDETKAAEPVRQKEKEEKDYSRITISWSVSRKAVRYAAIGAIVVLLSMFSPYHREVSDTQLAGFSLPTWGCDTLRLPEVADSVGVVPVEFDENMVLSTAHTASLIKEYGLPLKFRAHTVVASLPTREAAEQYCRNWKAEDGDLLQIHPNRSQTAFRVSVRSYMNGNDAANDIRKLRKIRSGFEKAWVWQPFAVAPKPLVTE